VTCPKCQTECKRHGHDRKGNQRFKCPDCSKTHLEPREKPLGGMSIAFEQAEMVLSMLLERMSVSSVVRLTGVHQKTILKLLVLAGEKCEKIFRSAMWSLMNSGISSARNRAA
jgi:transposase-like protein